MSSFWNYLLYGSTEEKKKKKKKNSISSMKHGLRKKVSDKLDPSHPGLEVPLVAWQKARHPAVFCSPFGKLWQASAHSLAHM